MSDITQVWEALKKKQAQSGYLQLRVRPEAACGLFLALRKPSGNLCLIVEVEEKSLAPDMEFKSSEGYSIGIRPSATRNHPHAVQIVLECKSPQFDDIFIALVEDIIDSIASRHSESHCVIELSERLIKWMRFMQSHGLEGLGAQQQQGLYGELLFLDSILIPITGTLGGVEAWVGPLGKNQDFHLSGASVEVKTSSSNSPDIVYVSNIGQLDPIASLSLFLLHVDLDARRGDKNTLPMLVSTIRERCKVSGSRAQQIFEERLTEAGYLDTQSSRYEHTEYTAKRFRFYKVGEGFPRLTQAGLPTGIGDVKYSLSLSACESFRVKEPEFINAIGGRQVGSGTRSRRLS